MRTLQQVSSTTIVSGPCAKLLHLAMREGAVLLVLVLVTLVAKAPLFSSLVLLASPY